MLFEINHFDFLRAYFIYAIILVFFFLRLVQLWLHNLNRLELVFRNFEMFQHSRNWLPDLLYSGINLQPYLSLYECDYSNFVEISFLLWRIFALTEIFSTLCIVLIVFDRVTSFQMSVFILTIVIQFAIDTNFINVKDWSVGATDAVVQIFWPRLNDIMVFFLGNLVDVSNCIW